MARVSQVLDDARPHSDDEALPEGIQLHQPMPLDKKEVSDMVRRVVRAVHEQDGFKRYTLKLPVDIHDELSKTAKASGVSVLDLLLRIVRLGLWIARETRNSPDAEIIVRAGPEEKTLVPLLN
jgi:hypothetical protein